MMKHTVKEIVLGAVAGAAATIPMSAVMWAGQQAGLIGKQPPEEITETALHTVGAYPSEKTENRLGTINHVLFGAAAGAVFGLGRRILPSPKTEVPAGIVYGLTVWLISYQGWIPALKIMPPISRANPGRPVTMAAAHIMFGATLAGLTKRLNQ